MKKLLYLITAIMVSLSVHATGGDNLTAKLRVADDLGSAKLSVMLNNADSYVAFQMDIQLPDGWAVEAKAPVQSKRLKDGNNVIIDDEEQSTDFQISCSVLEGNIVRILAYNFGNHPISLEAGEIFSIQLTKIEGEATVASDWKATFADVLFVTEKDMKSIQLYIQEKAASQTIAGTGVPKLGDINHDGVITGNDLIALLDIIAHDYSRDNYSGEAYDMDAADLNDDNIWNGNDLIALLFLL